MVSLVTNHGASTIILNIFDWKRCSISTLELAAVPHSCIPYVHTGFKIVLYIKSLFSSVSLERRFKSQNSFRNLSPSCFLLVNICVFQVSRRSKCTPKYLATSDCGICWPLSDTSGLSSGSKSHMGRFRFIGFYSPSV